MIALVSPHEEVKKMFYSMSDIIYIDQQGFWFYSKEKAKRILISNLNNSNYNNYFNIPLAKKYLNWWMPLFTRWVPNAEKYDLIREELLVLIYRVFCMFQFYNIKKIIFFTSVAHHLPGAIISIVAQLKKVKQVYLYYQIISGRLLPLEQSGSIDTRKQFDFELNNFTNDKSLDLFIQNKINNKQPIHNLQEKLWNKSFILAIVYLLQREVFKIFSKLNFKNIKKKSIFFTYSIKKYSFIEDLRVINSQRKFIKKYSEFVVSENKLQDIKNKAPLLLVAAHHQPEATTFPEGNNYNSHIDVVLELKNKKYKSKILYKEHFGSFHYVNRILGLTKVGISRSENYINTLKDLGCFFLPVNFSLSADDRSNWYLPVTMTGTIAIERALAGLHTIYTGEPWYKGMPGTVDLKNIKSLEKIPLDWINCNPRIAKEAKEFLKITLNNKTIANPFGIGSGIRDFSSESNEDFKKGMFKIINKLKEEF